jgi:hypothetical protein
MREPEALRRGKRIREVGRVGGWEGGRVGGREEQERGRIEGGVRDTENEGDDKKREITGRLQGNEIAREQRRTSPLVSLSRFSLSHTHTDTAGGEPARRAIQT